MLIYLALVASYYEQYVTLHEETKHMVRAFLSTVAVMMVWRTHCNKLESHQWLVRNLYTLK
jgi:hypothetical protein